MNTHNDHLVGDTGVDADSAPYNHLQSGQMELSLFQFFFKIMIIIIIIIIIFADCAKLGGGDIIRAYAMLFDNKTPFSKAYREMKVVRKIVLISLFLHMLQQFSGINGVFYYSASILDEAGFSDTWLGSIIVAIANFLAVVFVTFFIERKGRRILLLLSSFGM
ncbi:solute carrier family 2, facilitated glucose transporter member 2, partial [Reticulomyxa filosa]